MRAGEDRSIEELIEASSLGTPEAKALRSRTPREVVDRIMERVAEQPFAMPDRIAVDAKGYGWRVWNDEDGWSMVPTNPDNSPIPQPVTWFYKAEWIDKVLELASLLPDDLNADDLNESVSLVEAKRLIDLVQTIKAAFDA